MKHIILFLLYTQIVLCVFGIATVSSYGNNHDIGKTEVELAKLIQMSTVQDYSTFNLTTLSRNVVGGLVSTAYANDLRHVSNIINFIRTSQVGINKYYGYATLANEMVENGNRYTTEMLNLAYFVRLAMDEVISDAELTANYRQLIKTFPSGIQAVIFKQVVWIKNDHYSEYLYQADYHEVKDFFMTWRTANEHVSNGVFTMEPYIDANNNIYFHIRNHDAVPDNHKGLYMCHTGGYYDGDHRRARFKGCSLDSPRHPWYLVPIGNLFYIQTSLSMPYRFLYAPTDDHSFDRSKRWLLGWESRVTNGEWQIF